MLNIVLPDRIFLSTEKYVWKGLNFSEVGKGQANVHFHNLNIIDTYLPTYIL